MVGASHDERSDSLVSGEATALISVVIVSYNTRDFTLNAVRSVADSCRDIDCEIIVVDNSSSDGSAEAVRAAFPSAIVLERPNRGFASGCNEGLNISRGRYLLILNADIEVGSNTIQDCIEHLEANPRVGVLGCRLVHPAGSTHPTMFRFVTLRQLLWSMLLSDGIVRRSTRFGDSHYAAHPRDRDHDVEVVIGCFLLTRRKAVQQVGGLDERFFLYSEESEWCFRMRAAGWIIRYFAGAEAFHHGGASTGSNPVLSAVELVRSQILFLVLTRGRGVARIAAIALFIGTGVRLLLPSARRRLSKAELHARLRFLLGACLRLPVGQGRGTTLARP